MFQCHRCIGSRAGLANQCLAVVSDYAATRGYCRQPRTTTVHLARDSTLLRHDAPLFKMSVLNLPVELFQEILSHAIQVRGLRRGMRLCLVNSTHFRSYCHAPLSNLCSEVFSEEVIKMLFIFQLLDSYFRAIPSGKVVVLPAFTAAYLERRVANELNGGIPALIRIRTIAERLSHESTNSRDKGAYIKQLCPFIVNNCSDRMADLFTPHEYEDKRIWILTSISPHCIRRQHQ